MTRIVTRNKSDGFLALGAVFKEAEYITKHALNKHHNSLHK